MKQLTIVLWLCVSLSLTTTIVVGDAQSLNDYIDAVANQTSLSKAEAQFCFDKANVTLTDVIEMNHLLNAVEISDINNSGLTVGCMLACVCKKKGWMIGTHINVEELRKAMNSLIRLSAERRFLQDLILNTCVYQVKDLSNECEMIFKLTQCNSVVQDRIEKILIKFKNSENGI